MKQSNIALLTDVILITVVVDHGKGDADLHPGIAPAGPHADRPRFGRQGSGAGSFPRLLQQVVPPREHDDGRGGRHRSRRDEGRTDSR